MTWLKLDDSFATHPKIIGLSNRAFRTHVEALCYCAKHLTDGLVPKRALKCTQTVAKELTNCGLWAINEAGDVVIHDYLEWNPSKASIQAKRAEDSARKAKGNPDGIQTESRQRSVRNLLGIQASRPVPKEASNEASVKGPRKRDPIWDELAAIFGIVHDGTTAHGKRNRAVKDLRLSGANPESIRSAHRKYQKLWPNILPTDTALAKHYPQLVNGTIHATRNAEKGKARDDLADVLREA